MTLQPFSPSEKQRLRKIFDEDGWKIKSFIENYSRYSICNNKIIILTLKFPIQLPVRLNIPFEVANFQISIAFKIWNLNVNTLKIVMYLMKMLRQLALQISTEHNFPLDSKEKKKQLVDLLNLIIPDMITNESDRAWKNRIRVSLLHKRDQLKEFNLAKINAIVATLNKAGLKPTFNQPWEVNKGIPKIRTAETLFFSNDEPLDEFFILEKGYLTYFKDLELNKFYIRTFFDSYSPYILDKLFGNITNFKLTDLLENWIKFSRMLLNSIIEIINLSEHDPNELAQFKPEKEIDMKDINFEDGENNFSFSALHYESKVAKELYPIHNDLYNTPPSNFEVIETINSYTRAEELIKNYQFNEATELLNKSLIIFNKNRQRKIVVSILMLLTKITSLLNQGKLGINYLQNALSITKSGDVPINQIIKIHFKLGISYYKLREFDKALSHFNIIINFLENEETNFQKKTYYLGMAHLHVGLILSDQEKHAESKISLKKAFTIGNENIRVKLRFYLYRAIYHKNKNNISKAQKMLRLGVDLAGLEFEDTDYLGITIDLIMELSEFFIHYRKDSKKASHFLNSMKEHLNLTEISGIKRGFRWNLLMSDYFKFCEKDNDKSSYYLRKSHELKNQLRMIGVNE